jgi:NADH-quinone oxidoreductase subunit N
LEFVLPEMPLSFYYSAMPIFILALTAIVALMQSVFPRIGSVIACQTVCLGSLISSIAWVIVFVKGTQGNFLSGSYLIETLSVFGQIMILALALITALYFSATHLKDRFFRGEITSLYLMVVLGMLVLVSANEFISLFIGLELASIGLYALVGYIKPTRTSLEGAVKYFILGAFATGFLLFGLALLYAGTGSMVITDVIAFAPKVSDHYWIKLGAMFTMVGFGFKLALAPFHMWAPDAYEAAPTGITGFMATAVKVMVVIVMLRFVAQGLPVLMATWGPFFMFTAILSVTLGNILALVQSSVKRMLAYSSVAHAGYMAIAVCAISANSVSIPISAILFYLITYSAVSIGAFGVLMWLESEETDNLQVDDLSGLAQKHPWAAFALATFMFSFAGIPPTAGFMGKFFVFSAALNEGLYGLVIIGLVGAVISLYYYLRIIVKMYMVEPIAAGAQFASPRSWLVTGITALTLITILILGTVGPNRAMESMRKTALALRAN